MAIAERPVRVPSPDDERSPFYLPLPIDTRFTKHLAWAAESMTIADAVDDTLKHTGITVEVDATTSNANGAIFVADHSQHIEPLLAQIVARAYGREKSHVIAMPSSFTGRILQTALPNHDVVIPVIPTFFSREHEPLKDKPTHRLRREVRRKKHPDIFDRPLEELRQQNQNSMLKAADVASSGGAVTIFPAHTLNETRWKKGVGEIASNLRPGSAEDTDIVFIEPEHFSLPKLIAAFALRETGIRPIKQTIVVKARSVGRVSDVWPTAEERDASLPQSLTDKIAALYRAA